jgi:hypothetical protein
MPQYNWLYDEVVGTVCDDKVIPLYKALNELESEATRYEELLKEANSNPSNISFDDALDIVLSTDDWSKQIDPDSVDINTLASIITFQNSHELAYTLAFSSEPAIATALLEELLYYRSQNII